MLHNDLQPNTSFIETLRCKDEGLSAVRRLEKEHKASENYFQNLHPDKITQIHQGLKTLLTPALMNQHLPDSSDKENLDVLYKNLSDAQSVDEIRQHFLCLIASSCGRNNTDTQAQNYVGLRERARSMKSNDRTSALRNLFLGTLAQPFVNGFSMHAYIFSRYLNANKNLVNHQTLKLIIEFFYASYIHESTGFHSFGEVDAAFIRASRDLNADFLILGQLRAISASYKPLTPSIVSNNIHSPLTWAAAGNDFIAIEEILNDSTTDVNWQGIFGNTALHWAIANTNSQMALYLIEHAQNVNLNVQDKVGKTPLHLALGKGWYHFNVHPMSKPAEPPQAPVIQALIEKTDLTCTDKNGNTPLHIAFIRRDINCIDLLLKKNPQLVNQKNKQGKTPIDLLQLNYDQACRFIKYYAVVFTLNYRLWDENRQTIASWLQQEMNIHIEPEEEKPAAGSSGSTPQATSLENLNGPADVIFEEALFYMDELLGYKDQPYITQARNHFESFRSEIFKLKNTLASNQKISVETRENLAKATHDLTRKVATFTLIPEDIKSFQNTITPHLKSLRDENFILIGKILGGIIGAAIGITAGLLLGFAIAPLAPFAGFIAGYQAAIIGASLGGTMMAAIGFWAARSVVQKPVIDTQPLDKLIKEGSTSHQAGCTPR